MAEQAEETTIKEEIKLPNPFQDESWVNEPVKVETIEEKKEEINEDTKTEEKKESESLFPELKETKEETEVLDDKKEDTVLKILLKEENEEEVLEYLSNKKKLNKLTTSEVDIEIAEDIIKMGMKSKYKDLTEAEINHKFKKLFSFPPEPKQQEFEEEDVFEERKNEWKEKIEDIKKEIVIEAKQTKPELERIKKELVHPNILQYQEESKPTQEDLDKAKTFKIDYLKEAENVINSFEGFNLEYKDEDVTIPLAYNLSDEEKKSIAKKVSEFADNGYNANSIFAERWVKEDGSVNLSQMIKDLALLDSENKISQKFVSDGVQKRMVEYRKKISNIDVNNGTKETFNPNSGSEESEFDRAAKFFFSQT